MQFTESITADTLMRRRETNVMERSRQRNCQKEGKITFFRGGLERPLNKVKEDESIHLIWPMCAHTHTHTYTVTGVEKKGQK